MEDYQIALSPDLGLASADFVTAWNEEAETRTNGEARLAPTPSKGYLDPLTGTIVIGVVTGVAGNGIYDLIKRVLSKKGVRKHTHLEDLKKPDGTHLLIVDIDEK